MSHSHTSYATPIAIVVAGLIIAGAVLWSSVSGGSIASEPETQKAAANFRLPEQSDHMRGNPDAKITIIEFSDLECPFCAQLHPILSRIVDENTDVKWIYRHFPLTSIHSRAQQTAVASECIAKLGGNDAFWRFTDAVFADQRAGLATSFHKEFATSRGINAAAFDQCMKDPSVVAEVTADNTEAIATGGQGTPFSVIVTQSGRVVPFSGALPYEQVAGLVDQARAN